jgi:quercetin dioxygenase-like cupin family protein
MFINDDLAVRTLVHADKLDWTASPAKGVDRRMLFRVGDEKARATSLVRYAAGSHFARHEHSGGEEFLVIDGTFQDETGDFPVGSYVRNPPGTGHAPGSDDGCTILVKLWQFKQGDRHRVVRRPGEGDPAPLRPGVLSSLVLFDEADERVVIEEWKAGEEVELTGPAGLELFVLAGSFQDGGDTLGRLTWLRLPAGEALNAKVGPEGAKVWYPPRADERAASRRCGAARTRPTRLKNAHSSRRHRCRSRRSVRFPLAAGRRCRIRAPGGA